MEPIFALVLAGGIAVVAAIGHYNSSRQRMKRALEREPLRRIADVTDGALVKLIGTVYYAEEPIEAPLSGRPCAYYRAKVIHDKKNAETLINDVASCRDMWIEDGSDHVLVELSLAKVMLTMDAKSASGVLDEPNPRQVAFLEAHDQPATGWVFNKNLKYKEGVLEEGEEIVVFGLCRMEPDPYPQRDGERGYRECPMRTRIVAPPKGELLLSDDPEVVRPRALVGWLRRER